MGASCGHGGERSARHPSVWLVFGLALALAYALRIGSPMSSGIGHWPRACRVINTLRTSSRTSWKFERREACNTRWVFRASSVMPFCTSATFKLSLTSTPDSTLDRRSSTSTHPRLLAGLWGTRCEGVPADTHSAVLRFLFRTRPDSALSLTRVLQRLLRTLLAHHDQRTRIHVVADCCHVPGFAQKQQIPQRHWFAQ